MTESSALTHGYVEIRPKKGLWVAGGWYHDFAKRASSKRKHVTLQPDLGRREERRGVPDVRRVFHVEEDVDVRSAEILVEQTLTVSRIELPLVRVASSAHRPVVQAERRRIFGRLQSQGSADCLAVGGTDQDIDVIVPRDATVVAPGPNEGSGEDKVRHVVRFQGLGERLER